MNEVNGSKISVGQVNYSVAKPHAETPQENVETREIKDFGNPQAEALGRSMLFKGNDDVNNDIKALIENPQIAENSDEIFETAYNAAVDAGIANPYEEAASVATVSI